MPRTPWLACLVLLIACNESSAPTTSEPGAAPTPIREAEPEASLGADAAARDAQAAGEQSFSATVSVREPTPDAPDRAILVREDGERWVIVGSEDALWASFDGKPVEARGNLAKDGRADAFELVWLSTSDEAGIDPQKVGGLETLSGSVRVVRGEPGSKLEGSSRPTFSSDTGSFELMNRPKWLKDGVSAEVRARKVERSPFSAHVGGRWLWIESAVVEQAAP